MSGHIPDITRSRAARIAGVGYLILFVLAIFANFFVFEGLVETGDPAATAANIVDSEGLFRAGIVAFLVVFVLDVVIAWALYVFFRDLSKDLSLLNAWFRLVYTVFLGAAVVFAFVALQLLGGADYLAGGGLDSQALLALEAFDFTWLVGLAAFGLHLIVMGYLVIRSGWVTKILGYVLIVAGIAYFADTVAHTVLADYDDVADVFLAIVAIPSVIGELWLTIWLLFRAGREPATATP